LGWVDNARFRDSVRIEISVVGDNAHVITHAYVHEVTKDGIQVMAVDNDISGFSGESRIVDVVGGRWGHRPRAFNFSGFYHPQIHTITDRDSDRRGRFGVRGFI